MARFKADEVDRYGGQGGGGFFSLHDDGDVAKIRLLYNNIDDVEGLSVHKIEVDGKKRYVNCLREYNDPLDACPFCRERMYTTAKLFIPIYNVDEDKIQVWERGKKFFKKLSSLCARYPDLVSHVFEVERNGKAGDQQTTYELYEQSQDDTVLEDFEIPEAIGSVVLDKSADDMEYFLDEGQFPPEDDEQPRRRTSGKRQERDEQPRRRERQQEERKPAGRRTPARRRSAEDDEAFDG